MSPCWSERVARHYAIAMPSDLRRWLDDELWRSPGGAGFSQPLTPEDLLAPSREWLWPGFMLPDTLPLIGNQYGDWLCLRADRDSQVSEFLYWCHGGGDWLPYGRTLSEALLYDAATHWLRPQRPQFPEIGEETRASFEWAEWALEAMSPQLSATQRGGLEFWKTPPHDPQAPTRVREALEGAGLAGLPLQRELLLRHLESGLKRAGSPKMAHVIDVSWEPDFVSWMFDAGRLPGEFEAQLTPLVDGPGQDLRAQDWAAAERVALQVLGQRNDLAWAHDVAAYAAERRGDLAEAARRYWQGLQASSFADDTVALRTHWFDPRHGKFSAARLSLLREHLPPAALKDSYVGLFLAPALDPQTLRSQVGEHWISEARRFAESGRHGEAYLSWYAAGWDLGVSQMSDYEQILTGLAAAASGVGAAALQRLAQVQLDLLTQ